MKVRILASGLFFLTFVALVLVLSTWTVRQTRQTAISELQVATERGAALIGHSLRALELVMKTTATHVEATGKKEGLQPYMKQLTARLPPVRTITVISPEGVIRTDLRPGEPAKGYKVPDRAYFRAHLPPQAVSGYFYSPPIKSRLDGLTQITISVAARRAGGDLAAVVVSSIDNRFFSSLGQELKVVRRHDARILYKDGSNVYTLNEITSADAEPGVLVGVLARLFNGSQTFHHQQIAIPFTDLRFQLSLPAVSYLTEAAPIVMRGSLIISLILSLLAIVWWLAHRGRVQLMESEKKFRKLYNDSPVMMHSIDAERVLINVNKQWLETLGYESDEVIGHKSTDFLTESSKKYSTEFTLPAFFKTGITKNAPYQFVTKDGDVVEVKLSATSERNAAGEVVESRAVLLNETERLKAKGAQKETEAQFKAVVDSSPAAITLKDRDGHFILVNKTYSKWMDANPPELVGKTVHDLFSQEQADEIEALDQKVMETGEGVAKEAVRLFKDGQTRFVVTHKSPVYSVDGGVIAVSTTISDITLRKQAEESLQNSEERFRSAFENVAAGNIVIDDKGVIEVFNAAAETTFGYAAEEVIGRNVNMLMPEPDRGRHDGYIQKYLETDEANIIGIGREVTGLRKNGEKFPMHLSIGEMRIGDKVSFIGSVSDLSKVKALEGQLAQAQKMEAVGQLTGGVAHDFNNLLAIIIGNLEILDQTPKEDGDFAESLAEAIKAVERGSKLTYQLLAFSRQQTLSSKTVEANTLLFDTTGLLQRTLGEDIDCKTAFATDGSLIRVDPGMFGNAILNLALNARDAMPKGGKLTIKTTNVDLKGDILDEDQSPLTGPYVLITVADSGVGIKKKDLEHLFEPFFTTKEIGKGSGLGLSMVYGFVKQSGGHMAINSKRGKGTTVNLYFPAADSLTEGSVTIAPYPAPELKGTETILVVEDDDDVRKVTVRILNNLGYKVFEAQDGPTTFEALQVLESRGMKVDLVFSDVIMPGGMSDIELAHELERHYSGIKVLLTSGYPEKVIAAEGFDEIRTQLLAKPYRREKLVKKLRAVLDQ